MVLRKGRELKYSQRQLAVKVGCSQPYLAQVETGVRPISKRIAEKLEDVFAMKPGSYTKAVFPRADRVSGLENQFWPIGIYLGAEAARQVRQLEKQRPGEEHYWRHLNGIRYDSWTEKGASRNTLVT